MRTMFAVCLLCVVPLLAQAGPAVEPGQLADVPADVLATLVAQEDEIAKMDAEIAAAEASVAESLDDVGREPMLDETLVDESMLDEPILDEHRAERDLEAAKERVDVRKRDLKAAKADKAEGGVAAAEAALTQARADLDVVRSGGSPAESFATFEDSRADDEGADLERAQAGAEEEETRRQVEALAARRDLAVAELELARARAAVAAGAAIDIAAFEEEVRALGGEIAPSELPTGEGDQPETVPGTSPGTR